MMNTYKINYEQLRQQPEIAEMLSALQRGLEKFGIDFYLVGAVVFIKLHRGALQAI
jgi:hypothetical protein